MVLAWLYQLRKMHSLRAENCILFSELPEGFSSGGSLSDSSEGLLQSGKGGARIHRGLLQQKPGSQNIKRLLLIKENQTSQVNEFSTFLCLGRYKSPRSLKPLLYAP